MSALLPVARFRSESVVRTAPCQGPAELLHSMLAFPLNLLERSERGFDAALPAPATLSLRRIRGIHQDLRAVMKAQLAAYRASQDLPGDNRALPRASELQRSHNPDSSRCPAHGDDDDTESASRKAPAP